MCLPSKIDVATPFSPPLCVHPVPRSSIRHRCVVYTDTAGRRVGGVSSQESTNVYTCYGFGQGNSQTRCAPAYVLSQQTSSLCDQSCTRLCVNVIKIAGRERGPPCFYMMKPACGGVKCLRLCCRRTVPDGETRACSCGHLTAHYRHGDSTGPQSVPN